MSVEGWREMVLLILQEKSIEGSTRFREKSCQRIVEVGTSKIPTPLHVSDLAERIGILYVYMPYASTMTPACSRSRPDGCTSEFISLIYRSTLCIILSGL